MQPQRVMERCARLLVTSLLSALLLLAGGAVRAEHTRDRAVTRTLQRLAKKPVVRAALRRGALLRIAYARQPNGAPMTLALSGSDIVLLGALIERPRGRTSVPIKPNKKQAHDVILLSQVQGSWSSSLHAADLERSITAHAKRYLRASGELVVGDGPAFGFYRFIARHPSLLPRFFKAMRERGVVSSEVRTISAALKGVAFGAGGLAMMGVSLHDSLAPALGREPIVSSGAHGKLMFVGGAMTTLLGVAHYADKTRSQRTEHLRSVSRAMRDTLVEARARGIPLGELASWL
ncbi:MAG: hypothetical protein KC503_41690 [Myxococcales bacterium]|nr:hypothetical protein [Myxococcales bacterium]